MNKTKSCFFKTNKINKSLGRQKTRKKQILLKILLTLKKDIMNTFMPIHFIIYKNFSYENEYREK